VIPAVTALEPVQAKGAAIMGDDQLAPAFKEKTRITGKAAIVQQASKCNFLSAFQPQEHTKSLIANAHEKAHGP
jgi:hypothetical protein